MSHVLIISRLVSIFNIFRGMSRPDILLSKDVLHYQQIGPHPPDLIADGQPCVHCAS
jgi:hypothetical protein